jgi:hypothetical protein
MADAISSAISRVVSAFAAVAAQPPSEEGRHPIAQQASNRKHGLPASVAAAAPIG